MKRIRLEGFWSRLKDEAKNWKLSKGQKDEFKSFLSVAGGLAVVVIIASWAFFPTVATAYIFYLMWFA